MVTAVSTASTNTTTSASASSSTTVAQLKAELAAKQAELASAKTDDEKAKVNQEISKLKASIAKVEPQSAKEAKAPSSSNAGTQARAMGVAVTAADRAAPESKVSGAAMDVLMRMRPPSGQATAPDEAPDFSKLYAELDTDDDGTLSKTEFVAGSEGHLGEEEASALFDTMDSENAGALTQAQFTEGMLDAGPKGPPPMGPPPVGGPAQSAGTTKVSS